MAKALLPTSYSPGHHPSSRGGSSRYIERDDRGRSPLQWPPPSMAAIRPSPLIITSPIIRSELKWLYKKKSPLGTAGAAAPEYATDKDAGMIENRDLNVLVDIFDNIDPV